MAYNGFFVKIRLCFYEREEKRLQGISKRCLLLVFLYLS